MSARKKRTPGQAPTNVYSLRTWSACGYSTLSGTRERNGDKPWPMDRNDLGRHVRKAARLAAKEVPPVVPDPLPENVVDLFAASAKRRAAR